MPPNAKDQLPGRLCRLRTPKNMEAGPVNCIRSFGHVSYLEKSSFFPFLPYA